MKSYFEVEVQLKANSQGMIKDVFLIQGLKLDDEIFLRIGKDVPRAGVIDIRAPTVILEHDKTYSTNAVLPRHVLLPVQRHMGIWRIKTF
jgi:hypothetical protein